MNFEKAKETAIQLLYKHIPVEEVAHRVNQPIGLVQEWADNLLDVPVCVNDNTVTVVNNEDIYNPQLIQAKKQQLQIGLLSVAEKFMYKLDKTIGNSDISYTEARINHLTANTLANLHKAIFGEGNAQIAIVNNAQSEASDFLKSLKK